MRHSRPPFLARAILHRRISGRTGEAVEGDLKERYSRDRARLGSLRAGLRYWGEVLSPSLSEMNREILGKAAGDPRLLGKRTSTLSRLFLDLEHSIRHLAKSPGFTFIAVLSLALGIGPNTAVFSIVNATILDGPEGESPERLVDIYNKAQDGRWYYSGF